MIRDVIEREIEDTHVLSDEDRKELSDIERAEKEKEALVESFRRGAEKDARRWAAYEKLHGPFLEPAALEHFPEEHPYARFARTVNVTPCPKRRQKCLKEAETWRQSRDKWITRVVGPIISRRKRRRNLEAEADPETRVAARDQLVFLGPGARIVFCRLVYLTHVDVHPL